LGDNINTITRNTQSLINAGMEVGLEGNRENKEYVDDSSPESRLKPEGGDR
jgi:hypothetical protein